MPSRPSIALAFAALAALALAACATQPTKLVGLSSVDESALRACRADIQARSCAGQGDADACWQDLVRRYEALAEDAARKRFLVEAGCPSPTVETWLPDVR